MHLKFVPFNHLKFHPLKNWGDYLKFPPLTKGGEGGFLHPTTP